MAGSALVAGGRDPDALLRRVESMLLIAREHQTGVPIRELPSLLHEDGPRSDEEMRAWIEQHPAVAQVRADLAVHPTVDHLPSDAAARAARGRRYLDLAAGLVGRQFGLVAPLLSVVSVTGSTAYGEPESGDDLDLLVIVRDGALWVFLAYAYAVLRLRPVTDLDRTSVTTCLNYVATEARAREEFGSPRGLLFAREALTARPVLGTEEYRQLIAASAWMEAEFPRLYSAAVQRAARPRPIRRAPFLVRCANALVYPWLSAYLRLDELRRNRGFRAAGAEGRTYEVTAALDKLFFHSVQFEHLRSAYERGARPAGRPTA